MSKIRQVRMLTLAQVEKSTGITRTILRRIKTALPSAFTKNEIFVEKVVAYYDDHKAELDALEAQSLAALDREKAANAIILQHIKIDRERIELDEAKKQSLQIGDVTDFMSNFGTQLGAVLKSKLTKELPPQIFGLKSEEELNLKCREMYNSLIELLKRNMSEWDNESYDHKSE